MERTEPTMLQVLSAVRSYLNEEERPAEAFRRFAAFLGGRGGGLVITRTNPKRVRETYDLSAERVLWLTDREGSAEDTIAPALERIVYEIEDFMSKQPRGAVLLDGIERKSTRLNSSHGYISYAVFCLKKKMASGPGVPVDPEERRCNELACFCDF